MRKGGARKRYEEPVSRNELLAACDIVKEMLARAYAYRQEKRMRDAMERIVEVCRGTGNRHFEWFARLVEGHMDGIVTHARHRISSGKVEGTNQMIKTLRRTGYGYPDDEYFFLRIFDASRRYSNTSETSA
ncbi:transposase [Pseudoscardovia suis]|uniref:transposase n=1 Tax=Pseudoscardovia suis TaxID=987063 RepID=UPI003F9C62C1